MLPVHLTINPRSNPNLIVNKVVPRNVTSPKQRPDRRTISIGLSPLARYYSRDGKYRNECSNDRDNDW